LDITARGIGQFTRALKEKGVNIKEFWLRNLIYREGADKDYTINGIAFHTYRIETYRASLISKMNLVDVVEMFCDWLAATKRMQAGTGDMMKSIAIGQERFGYSDDFRALLENTYKDIFEGKE
jgi:hypothetical protein